AEPVWPGFLAATAQCVRFYSRLPMPALPGESDPHAIPDFRTIPRVLPLAALLIVAPAALVLVAGLALGLGEIVAAALAVTTLVLTTGAFHEDGLADSADGLFGGHTVERRLEIMKDSRVGTFGAVALGLALLLRVALLALIVERAGAVAGLGAILAASGWSRAEGIRILSRDAPARVYGAAAAVGRPPRNTALIGLALAAFLALFVAVACALPLYGVGLGLTLATLVATGMAALARRLIGGPTGDIAGAVQQLGEIAIYLGIALLLPA
ncbi:MAG: adenosylcobinamide-GDP ribazoletransferase, partial [Bosea sp. (in: a-proteobacteria)]